MHHTRIRILSAALAGALALPALTATSSAAAAPSGPVPASAEGRAGFVTRLPDGAGSHRDEAEADEGRRVAQAAASNATLADDYDDECDDAGKADIAKFLMLDDQGRNVAFGWSTCHGKPMTRGNQDEMVVYAVDEDPTREFLHDRVVVQWMDGYYEVYATYDSAPPQYWDLLDNGYGTVDFSNPGRTIGTFVIDAVAASFPYDYWFTFQTFDASGERDVIPNPGHPVPTFPSYCDTIVFSDRATVRTDPGGFETAVAAATAAGYHVTSRAPGIGTFAVEPAPDLGALDRLPGVANAYRPAALTPSAVNDPEPSQWALAQLRLEQGWAKVPSHRVEMAIVDSGIDASRPDLAGRVASGYDAVANRPIPAGANSAFGAHGTAVAGVAAATRNNRVETAGANPGLVVRPYRTSSHDGCISAAAVAAALDHIATVPSIRIVNMSFGGRMMDPAIRDAVRRLNAAGKVLIAATGNDGASGKNASFPASFAEVIGIGATGPDGRVTPYSQTANVEFVAPGGSDATRAAGIAILDEFDQVTYATGTSFSAPYVAGVVSLWLASNPKATTDQVRAALRAAAVDVPGTTADGYGLVDAERLLARAGSAPTAPPSGSAPVTQPPTRYEPSGVPLYDGDMSTTGRLDTGDAFRAAAAVSSGRFAPDGARHVVLARNDAFADALAASPLTGEGPLLYTFTGRTPDFILAEIDRVLAPGGTVYVLGGDSAIRPAVAQQLASRGYRIVRLAGPSRVDTAVAVANEVWRLYPSQTRQVIVARAYGDGTAAWADSVSVGAWAAYRRIPVVLTATGQLDGAPKAFLAGLKPHQTTLVGGTAALSDAVMQAVPNPYRVSGASRAATAVAIASQLWRQEPGPRRLQIVNGSLDDGWAFGLVAAGIGADAAAPVLYVQPNAVPPETLQAVGSCGPRSVDLLLVGDGQHVTESQRQQLDARDGTAC